MKQNKEKQSKKSNLRYNVEKDTKLKIIICNFHDWIHNPFCTNKELLAVQGTIDVFIALVKIAKIFNGFFNLNK
jgi:hypothetical protein